MTGSAIIDYCCTRMGRPTTDSTLRAQLLLWLNAAQRQIMAVGSKTNEGTWWFRMQVDTFAFTAGQNYKTLDLDRGDTVLFVQDVNGRLLQKVPLPSFLALYGDNSVADANPTVYAMQSLDANNVYRVLLWPTPNASTNGTFTKARTYSDLADTTASVSLIPEQFHQSLADMTLAQALNSNDKLDSASPYGAYGMDVLSSMMAQHEQVMRGGV